MPDLPSLKLPLKSMKEVIIFVENSLFLTLSEKDLGFHILEVVLERIIMKSNALPTGKCLETFLLLKSHSIPWKLQEFHSIDSFHLTGHAQAVLSRWEDYMYPHHTELRHGHRTWFS